MTRLTPSESDEPHRGELRSPVLLRNRFAVRFKAGDVHLDFLDRPTRSSSSRRATGAGVAACPATVGIGRLGYRDAP